MSRFRLLVVAVVATISLVLQGVVPAGAVELGVHYSGEAADYLSARVQAAASGKRVLVGSALDEFSTTWVNPDGTRTTEAFGSPIRVRDEGGHFGWRDLDFTLVENVDGTVGARSGLLPLSISGGGSAEQVAATGLVSVVQSENRSFGFGWDGALPKPVLDGDTARFVEVLDGVDLLVRLDATGFEQFFEVKRKPSVVVLDQLRLRLQSRNVSVVATDEGFDFRVAGVIDFYVNSLGTGLNSTVHVDNGVKTVSLDVNDLRGNTVTRINLDTATTDSWVSFDEYGNRDTASTGKLVTYDAYGQYERATTSQGLILMGARVYNPVTNQFTSPDPVTGGNETSYTYPNDSVNKNDLSGLCQTPSSSKNPFCVRVYKKWYTPWGVATMRNHLEKYNTKAWDRIKFEMPPMVIGSFENNLKPFLKDSRFVTLSLDKWSRWKNMKWLVNGIVAGRPIILSDDPARPWGRDGNTGRAYSQELKLLQLFGFKFEKAGQLLIAWKPGG